MQLTVRRNAIVKPVLLIYPRVDEITNFVNDYIENNPLVFETTFEKENQIHTFWKISDQALIRKIQELFKEKVPETYIADGHHRSSSTALMHQMMEGNKHGESFDVMLSAFFPADELEIHDFNRVVERNCSLTTFMAKLSRVFDIEILDAPKKTFKKV